MDTTATDRIEREVTIRAPCSRVWEALASAEKFGEWFGVDFTGVKFIAGQVAIGKMTYPGFEGRRFEIEIDRIEPERLFSYRWHPYGIDPNYDYSVEPMTLITFELEEVEGGTKLTVVESGFDQIPLARRAEAYRMDSGGWDMQIQNITAYVARS